MRDIRATISELYYHDLSEEQISSITESVNDAVREWQNQQLSFRYSILYLDCIAITVQENKSIIYKTVYLALGILTDGVKELLGKWVAQNEGAKIWLSVLVLNNRCLKEVFVACYDGLTRFPDAILLVFI